METRRPATNFIAAILYAWQDSKAAGRPVNANGAFCESSPVIDAAATSFKDALRGAKEVELLGRIRAEQGLPQHPVAITKTRTYAAQSFTTAADLHGHARRTGKLAVGEKDGRYTVIHPADTDADLRAAERNLSAPRSQTRNEWTWTGLSARIRP